MTGRILLLSCFLTAGRLALGSLTLDESFGGVEKGLGPAESGWATNAAALVGENAGSIFFTARFERPDPSQRSMRTVVTLRTNSRLTLGFNSFGNDCLRFSFSDGLNTFRHEVIDKIEFGREYHVGVTWDGSVIRIYLDGKAVASAHQPLAFKKGSVRNLNLGPYKDGWHGMRTWSRDVFVSRLRVWDDVRTPAEVASEEGVELRPLVKAAPMRLAVPALPDGVAAPSLDGKLSDDAWAYASSLPQLIRGNFTGKSGQLPPHSFMLAYDRENLYLGVSTLFPPHDPFIEGQPRTASFEPEAWGTESFEFLLALGGHRYRFASNVAGGTTESRDKQGRVWNGEWKFSHSREMKIDDSILWQFEAAIPWKTLDRDGPPPDGETARFNFARTWTLSSLGGHSSLNIAGRGYPIDDDSPVAVFGPSAAFRLVKRTDPSDGDYHQEWEVVAPGKAAVRYSLCLARLDGSLAPMPVCVRERRLAAGERTFDAVDVKTDAPGYDALLHVLESDGRVVMREIVPYTLNPELIRVTPLLLSGKVRVTPKRPLAGLFALVAPDGSTVAERDAVAGEAEFPFPRENAAGEWSIELRSGGKVLDRRAFPYPGVGEWEKQDFHEDWVIPPFTPMTNTVARDGLGVSLYGRVYDWRMSLLPSRVESMGEDLFAAPPEILVNGEPAACETFEVVSNAPHHAGFRAAGKSVSVDGWLEYDGVQWNDVAVTPETGGATLQVRYFLKGEIAKYLHAAAGSGWGVKRTAKIADGVQMLSAFNVLWTGNEEKGWAFFYETRSNWTCDAARTYTLDKSSGRLAVTVDVARGLPAGKPFRFGFGFQATPVRPRASNRPFDTLGWSWAAAMNRPGRRPTMDIAYMAADGAGDLGGFFGDLDEECFRRRDAVHSRVLKACEGHGVRPVVYTCSRHLSARYPETVAYLPEWTFRPELALDYSRTGHFLYDCCPVTKASDFFMWKFRWLLRHHPGLRGIYLDFGTIHPCSNGDHGCNARMPILGQREFYRRLVVVQLEAGIREPVVVIHNTDCVQIPAFSFTTHLLNGEHIRQASSSILHNKKDLLDTYGIEMFASELSSLPWGISNSVYTPYDTLSKANGGDEACEPYQFRMTRASMAATLVHDTMQCQWRSHFGLFDKVVRIYDRFGVDKARFVGYWRNPSSVVSGEDVYVSCYVRDGRVLAVVSHLGRPHIDQTAEIAFDWKKLGVALPGTAVERLSEPDPEYDELFSRRAKAHVHSSRATLELGDFGTAVEGFDGTTLRLRLPHHSFALVEFSP